MLEPREAQEIKEPKEIQERPEPMLKMVQLEDQEPKEKSDQKVFIESGIEILDRNEL